MRLFSVYILRQIVGPFVLFTWLLTTIVWLTQSPRLIDLVINHGQSVFLLIYVTVLMLPGVLIAVLPVAFLCAALHALHNLSNDSELVVMWSAGVSYFQMARPVLYAAGCALALTYLCSLYFMPLGQRLMNEEVSNLNSDVEAAALHEGEFNPVTNDLTVFIRQTERNGRIHGILVHDNHVPTQPVTYIAEFGFLVQTQSGARLVLTNGNIEKESQSGARLTTLSFDRYVFDLSQYATKKSKSGRDISERYLYELLFPKNEGPNGDARRRTYIVEGHSRLSSPLYIIAFACIALAAMTKGSVFRSSYVLRTLVAATSAILLRLIGFGVQSLAAGHLAFWPLLYAVPVAGAIATFAVPAEFSLLTKKFHRLLGSSIRSA